MRKIVTAVLVVVFVMAFAPTSVSAQVEIPDPQCFQYLGPLYPGAKIILNEEAAVRVTFCDGSAGYTSDTYLHAPGFYWVGTGHQTPMGTQFDVGVYAAGTELIFAIYVRNTGHWFFTGPASRNGDNQIHAAISEHPDGYTWNIGFEDLWGGGDRDYNDINLIVQGDLVVIPDDPDTDDDGIPDEEDNCPETPNPDQADADGDGFGDVCDICPFDADNDADEDGVCGDVDNCDIPNPDQADADGDGFGDVCDICPFDADNDIDQDGVCGDIDNCPDDPNEDQSDLDKDGLGDVCDPCTDVDRDSICIEDDLCPNTVLPEDVPTVRLGTWRWADVDGDGIFDTRASRGRGPGRYYTIEDTAGCSCEQIIEALELGAGHSKFGCSISAMDDWTALVSEQQGGGEVPGETPFVQTK